MAALNGSPAAASESVIDGDTIMGLFDKPFGKKSAQPPASAPASPVPVTDPRHDPNLIRVFYRESLARVGKPVPGDLLMQMSGDLGSSAAVATPGGRGINAAPNASFSLPKRRTVPALIRASTASR